MMLSQGEVVRLNLIGLGGELDLHSPGFTNQVLVAQGSRTYSTEISPSLSATVDFTAGERFFCDALLHDINSNA
jgi:hypothetical protein